jgi:hypothetical protein
MSFSAFYGTFLFARQVSEAEFSTSLLAFIVPMTKPSLGKPHLSTKPLHNSGTHKADNAHFKYCGLFPVCGIGSWGNVLKFAERTGFPLLWGCLDTVWHKRKGKFALEQTMKAQRGE